MFIFSKVLLPTVIPNSPTAAADTTKETVEGDYGIIKKELQIADEHMSPEHFEVRKFDHYDFCVLSQKLYFCFHTFCHTDTGNV